ncbi:MAG: hypothetical protein GY935_06510, partial [Gammaproteobacteria bacterium]|nr:hypothetical protein [Gammaproteobacteria bacterium]
MLMVFLSVAALIVAAAISQRSLSGRPVIDRAIKGSLVVFAILGFLSRSFIIVDGDEIGALKRIYLGDQLPSGRIIALEGQNGPQAEVLGPGFHLIPFVRVINEIEYFPVQEVPEGQYGLLVANDGRAIDEGAYLANPWPVSAQEQWHNATYFLENGGQKGPQYDVLKP